MPNTQPSPSPPKDLSQFRRPKKVTYDHTLTTEQEIIKLAKDYRSAATSVPASMISTIVGYPLDTIKVRMQGYTPPSVHTISATTAQSKSANYHNYGAIDCARAIYRNEGWKGFYRGFFPPMFTIAATRGIQFYCYAQSKYFLDEICYTKTGISPLETCNDPNLYPTLQTVAVFSASGAVAGAISTAFSCPFELVKTAQQLSAEIVKSGNARHPLDDTIRKSYATTSSPQMAQALYNHRGFFGGLYCGYGYQLRRDTIATAVYFSSYETIKQAVSTFRRVDSDDKLSISIAGFWCGILGFLSSYPLDTMRTRYQKSCLTSSKDHIPLPKMEVFNRSMWRGWWVGLGRSGFVNTAMWLGYEMFKKFINKLEI